MQTTDVNTPSIARALTYDANGNLTNDGNGKVYTYDAANRLSTVTQGSTVTGYVYDGYGRRVQETSNGTLVKQWVWCGGDQPCEERDSSNNVTKRFYAQGEQIGGTNYYISFDHQNSVREMTDSTGAIRARYDYDPYGRMTKIQGDLDADFRFTGFYYDQATGLYFSRTRVYSPDLARWLTRDTIGEAGGINLYQYIGNNPVNAIDPSGRFAPAGAAVGLATGTTVGTVALWTGGIALAGGVGYGAGTLLDRSLGISDHIANWIEGPIDESPLPKPQMPPPKPPCNKKAPPGFPGDEPQNHHNYPQEFRDWFEQHGLDIDDPENMTKMPQQWHTGEDISIHSNGYNGSWAGYIEENPNASPSQIKAFMQQTTNQMGFGTLPTHL